MGMENIKIPKLKSRYIPVHSIGFIEKHKCKWWDDEDSFIYPNVLLNLNTFTPKQSQDLIPKHVFLLTDSGGFQVIRGECNFDWKESFIKQINLNATKIFSFDIPPVKRKSKNQNIWISMFENEVKKIIEQNVNTALQQSQWLKENYPDKLNRFCYVMQATSIDTAKYNLEYLEKKIGMENYSKYFPGGIVASCKSQDILLYSIIARYLYENFITRGIYVHYLGIGSFYKMLVTIRNEITTFDSSNVLRGISNWEVYNPINLQKTIQFNKSNFFMLKTFCICPNCVKTDFNKLLQEEKYVDIGCNFVIHNLYFHLMMNVFLDSIDKSQYTKIILENFKISNNVKIALEFCDDADKLGFNMAVEKYKFYLKKEESKQGRLF
jgi:queuine/archaeosine tRNA-ribosyltransferase